MTILNRSLHPTIVTQTALASGSIVSAGETVRLGAGREGKCGRQAYRDCTHSYGSLAHGESPPA